MSNLVLVLILAAAVPILAGMFLFYPRKVAKPSQEPTGTVSCKKCSARIAVSNPSKLQHDFSLKCTACETRKFYKLVELTW